MLCAYVLHTDFTPELSGPIDKTIRYKKKKKKKKKQKKKKWETGERIKKIQNIQRKDERIIVLKFSEIEKQMNATTRYIRLLFDDDGRFS